MEDHRLPKQMLFGELKKTRPRHGTKKRWRDVVAEDVESIGLASSWYEEAQDRRKWRKICEQAKESSKEICIDSNSTDQNSYRCQCGRSFSRKGDLTRHSRFCQQQQLPTNPDSVFECVCGRSFRRRGDLTRHSRFCNTTTTTT